jgi:hypothetical protein
MTPTATDVIRKLLKTCSYGLGTRGIPSAAKKEIQESIDEGLSYLEKIAKRKGKGK